MARAKSRRASRRKAGENPSPDVIGASLELELVRLMAFDARQNLTRQEMPGKLENTVTIQVASDQANENKVVAVFVFELQANYEDTPAPSSPSESVIFVRAVFQSIFRRRDAQELPQDGLALFGNTTGLFVVWPYWREFVQSTTVRMALPPLTLPLIQARPGAAPQPIFGEPVETGDPNKSRGMRRKKPSRQPKR